MELVIAVMAFATSVLSALALYAGSAHCRWKVLRAWRGVGGWAGLALAGLSLWLWVLRLGGGAGLCAMLGTWMLAMMLLPWLGLRARGAGDAPQGKR
ncbi:MAG: hypothetical protein ABIP44_08640 [Pseudoxanthomonas sp.]